MKVVAIGGGHGTAVTLRALRSLNCDITAIVSVADDGGSTGALRNSLQIAGIGDIRKCLLALSSTAKPWNEYLEYRFDGPGTGNHALGNLLLAAALARNPSIESAVAEVGQLLDACGTVLPASQAGVQLEAETGSSSVLGQVEISRLTGIDRIRTVPGGVHATESGLRAIDQADLVVLVPGSLYTSVLAACVVPGITDALSRSSAQRIWIANLQGLDPESLGLGLIGQYEALTRHGVEIDAIVVHSSFELETETIDVDIIRADLVGANNKVHDSEKLARVLQQIMSN